MSKAVRVAAHKKYLIVTCVIFCVYTVILIFPELWLLVNSFKDYVEFSNSPWGLPEVMQWSNYGFIFENFAMGEAFVNSIVLCLACPTAGIVSTTFAAYALSKFEFRGKKVLYFIHILPMLVCIAGSNSTLYMFFNDLGIYDTFFSLIWTAAGGVGMNFLLVYGVFKNVSRTYMEAAEIDGAGDFTVFVKIMLPQAIGIVGTLWMLSFIGSWNEYASYQLFLPSHPTVSTALVSIQTNVTSGIYANHYPEFFAAIMISIVPVVLIFLVFQEQIMQMSLGGGIKG
jgi:ABC-type glycerol-3-phosphate transport system permease component